MKVDRPLPPPTMTPREIRAALWDIAARQRKGEGAKVLNQYADLSETKRSLEARFLAASAIPDDDESWKALDSIARDQPKFYWTHAGVANIYARWKVRDWCEKEVNNCFQLGPEFAFTYTVRGNLYRNLGEHALAIRDYATALRADPQDADARVGQALSRKAMGAPDAEVRAELEHALRDVPTQYEAAETMAQLLDEANDPGALAAWERVEELAPRNRAAKLALARLRGDSDPDGAIRAYESAAKVAPLSRPELSALASLYRARGRTDDETKSLDGLVKMDPKDATPWRRLAQIHESRSDWNAAETAFKALLAANAKDGTALLGMGRVSEKRMRIRQAMDFYSEASKAGDSSGDREFKRLATTCLVPEKAATGRDIAAFNTSVSDALERLYNKRLSDMPSLRGYLAVKAQTDADGRSIAVEIRDNTLNDPWLEAHIYYALMQATWPAPLRGKRGLVLKWDLPPDKR